MMGSLPMVTFSLFLNRDKVFINQYLKKITVAMVTIVWLLFFSYCFGGLWEPVKNLVLSV